MKPKRSNFLLMLSAEVLLLTLTPAYSAANESVDIHAEAVYASVESEESASSGSFLLIIPGSALVGTGVGMVTGAALPGFLIGAGAGMVIWGVMVHR